MDQRDFCMIRFPLLLAFVLVTAVSALLGYQFKGVPGFKGVAAGIGLGVLLVVVSHFLMRLSDRAEGTRMLAAFYGSLVWSFGAIVAAVMLTKWLYPDLVASVVLPALGFYLVYRFDSGLRLWTGSGTAGLSAPGAGVSEGELK